MSDRITRREFLQVAGLGACASAALVGGGSRPFSIHSQSEVTTPASVDGSQVTQVATTCSACGAGCGILVRQSAGKPLQIVGNPAHPLNQGGICTHASSEARRLVHPERLQGALMRHAPGAGFQTMDWKLAGGTVAGILRAYRPSQIAFLAGLFPDHLYDLLGELSKNLGGVHLCRYSPQSLFEARVTLMDAVQSRFGMPKTPYFDLRHADLIFTFGATFGEPWLSAGQYGHSVPINQHTRNGYTVQLGPYLPANALAVDEWIPIAPGSEALVAGALAHLVSMRRHGVKIKASHADEIVQFAASCGVEEAELERLARLFLDASHPVAAPGGGALGSTAGPAAARAILELNVLVDNLGRAGGLYLLPDANLYPGMNQRPGTIAEVRALVERIKAGQIKALFVHGLDPIDDLPGDLGFADAIPKLDRLVSFAPFMDRTASQADYIFPDRLPLESWGYQKVESGVDRLAVSAIQPVVPPGADTRATADVLLDAVGTLGGALAKALPFDNEVDFLRSACAVYLDQGGFYPTPDLESFWEAWLQNGGWWTEAPTLLPPVPTLPSGDLMPHPPHYQSVESEYRLQLYPYTQREVGSRDRPKSRWGFTVVEIHPQTASELGVSDGDIVRITSPYGEMRAVLGESTSVHTGVVALPVPRTRAPGRIQAASNALDLLGAPENGSGDLAFTSTKVKLTKV